jgi:hypothetical protein
MNETIARPVVAGKFWIVKEQDQKVGSLEKDKGGYVLRTNNGIKNYKTIGALRDIAKISFENAQEKIVILSSRLTDMKLTQSHIMRYTM